MKRSMLWEVKFLEYSPMYKFDGLLEQGANLPTRENNVYDPSVLDPSNDVDKAKIKMKWKNDGHDTHHYLK